jgi:hypothetical protein
MAEDDAKGRRKRKPRAAKKMPAKSTPAAVRTAKARAKTTKKPMTRSEAETVSGLTQKDVSTPPPGLGPRQPFLLGILGGLTVFAVLAILYFPWSGAWDRVASVFFKPGTLVPVAAPKPIAKPIAVADPWNKLADHLAALKVIEDRLADLASSVKVMEGQLANLAAPSEGSGTLALMALAGALRQGVSFAPLAARVRGDLAAKGDGEGVVAALDRLASYAAKGVPTRPILAARLAALPLPAPKIDTLSVKAVAKPEQQVGLWNKIQARFFRLVEIRRVVEINGPESDDYNLAGAAVAKALARGDLVAADQLSATLIGQDAKGWRKDLRARIQANGLAVVLDGVIALRLGPKADKT